MSAALSACHGGEFALVYADISRPEREAAPATMPDRACREPGHVGRSARSRWKGHATVWHDPACRRKTPPPTSLLFRAASSVSTPCPATTRCPAKAGMKKFISGPAKTASPGGTLVRSQFGVFQAISLVDLADQPRPGGSRASHT